MAMQKRFSVAMGDVFPAGGVPEGRGRAGDGFPG